MQERSAVRIVPRNPITVALQEAGAPFAYGVVANISEGGACIWTNARLEPGRSLALRLSFPKGSQPVQADGVVIWVEAESQTTAEGLRYGIQWSGQTPGRSERLTRMITAAA
ncbi:MAG TPA: PilZ domain-containing protein [Vicinamibacteria bacterium]|nr:PilZ domain-containing protein [Vicinamibacteria bacterium]